MDDSKWQRSIRATFNLAAGQRMPSSNSREAAEQSTGRSDNTTSAGLGQGPKIASGDELGKMARSEKYQLNGRAAASRGQALHQKTLGQGKKGPGQDGPGI